jgi:hypothetical protein
MIDRKRLSQSKVSRPHQTPTPTERRGDASLPKPRGHSTASGKNGFFVSPLRKQMTDAQRNLKLNICLSGLVCCSV